MNREVTLVLAMMLTASGGPLFAQTVPVEELAATRPLMVVDHRTSLIPERWCSKSKTPVVTLHSLFVPKRLNSAPLTTADFVANDFRSADHAALAARLAELDSQRLFKFWQGRSMGLFFGITEDGYVGLSLGESSARAE